MRITLMLTGKTRISYIREGVAGYEKRIGHYMPFSEVIIPDLKSTGGMDQRTVMNKEGEAILKRISGSDYLVLLDERGRKFDSIGFAEHLQKLEGRTGHVIFLVGGAFGFSEQVYGRADEKISLSEMTFSHQLVRLIFTEQLYRALTILRGEPYHHK